MFFYNARVHMFVYVFVVLTMSFMLKFRSYCFDGEYIVINVALLRGILIML